MSLALAEEELGIIEEIYSIVENETLDEITLLQIEKAAQADDMKELKHILERIRW